MKKRIKESNFHLPFISLFLWKSNFRYAVVLAFDVKVLPEAQYFADNNGIKIYNARIIYHLFDMFKEHIKKIKEERKLNEGKDAIFPAIV